MILDEILKIATIVGIVIALATYITSSCFQFRNKKIDNLKRYFDAHDKIFEPDSYITLNVKSMENGKYKRNLKNKAMEIKFNCLLGEIEKIALLTANKAIGKEEQIYMFGWFAQKIQPQITAEERKNIYWELAIHYLDELKKAADAYTVKDSKARSKYLKKKKLLYT